jgi:hypothetical protein
MLIEQVKAEETLENSVKLATIVVLIHPQTFME